MKQEVMDVAVAQIKTQIRGANQSNNQF